MSKSRRIGPRGRVRSSDQLTDQAVGPILDRDFTQHRDGQKWHYEEGRMYIDGKDVNGILSDPRADVGTYLALAGGIDGYRKHVIANTERRDQLTKFEAVAEALLGRVFGRLKKEYDQKTSGLAYTVEDGHLILNGINVRSFLAMYRLRKTEKAEHFLRGLQGKIRVLQQNPDHERIRHLLQDVYNEISDELNSSSPSHIRRPLPPRRH